MRLQNNAEENSILLVNSSFAHFIEIIVNKALAKFLKIPIMRPTETGKTQVSPVTQNERD